MQGTGRAADLIAEALEIYEEELMRGGAEDSDAPDVAVMEKNKVPSPPLPFLSEIIWTDSWSSDSEDS